MRTGTALACVCRADASAGNIVDNNYDNQDPPSRLYVKIYGHGNTVTGNVLTKASDVYNPVYIDGDNNKLIDNTAGACVLSACCLVVSARTLLTVCVRMRCCLQVLSI